MAEQRLKTPKSNFYPTLYQLNILNLYYRQSPYVCCSLKKTQIAEKIGSSCKNVTNWFQSHRKKTAMTNTKQYLPCGCAHNKTMAQYNRRNALPKQPIGKQPIQQELVHQKVQQRIDPYHAQGFQIPNDPDQGGVPNQQLAIDFENPWRTGPGLPSPPPPGVVPTTNAYIERQRRIINRDFEKAYEQLNAWARNEIAFPVFEFPLTDVE